MTRRTRFHALVVLALTSSTMACARTAPTVAEAPTTRPSATGCPAPALSTGYIPDGFVPTDKEAVIGMPDRARTWAKNGAFVQLDEGFSGDHGDEPRLKRVTVRGAPASLLTDTYAADGPLITIDWEENTRCGPKQYLVVTKGLSEGETLRIAQELEGSTT